MGKFFKIPWASWYDPQDLTLELPDSWEVEIFELKDAKAITDEKEIETALNNSLGTPSLSELAKGKKNAAIVVDDISRHTKPEKILQVVLRQLNEAGIRDENVTLIVALGAHRPMMREDFIKKIGIDILDRLNVENHHPFLNLKYLGDSKLGTPIHVNKTYYESDLKITISGVIPHTIAGFGGGAKIILPGVCGLETLEANHSASLRGIGIGIGCIPDLRRDIEDVCSKVGLDFSINMVPTIFGEIAGVFAGHYIEAHRKAVEYFRTIYETQIPRSKFDVGFFNAYPEDTELSQSVKALNMYLLNSKLISFRGAVVMLTASTEGRGYHSLNAETGAPLYKNYGDHVLWKTIGRRSVFIYSPNVSRADILHFYPKSITFEKDFKKLINKVEQLIGKSPSACIVPSSIQLPKKESC